jgi:hypothetical protein
MIPTMRRSSGLSRIEHLFIIGGILLIAALAIPPLVSSQRAAHEREASTALKALSAAEADFRTNDRDKNGVNDFWTADVKGLYTLTPAEVPGARDSSIKLIELSVAAADADGVFVPAGGENAPLSAFTRSKAKAGYWFLALLSDRSVGDSKEATYALDTGGKPPMGSVHHPSRFGFAAFADSTKEGKYIFIINENNTIFRQDLPNARRGTAVPPGREGLHPWWRHWPNDDDLKRVLHPRDCCPVDLEHPAFK